MIKVLLVDDHDLVRTGLSRLLSDAQGIEVIGEAKSGEEAITKQKQHQPSVVLMDANMPGIGCLEATRRMLRFDPDLKVIALTVHGDEPYPSQFINAGAMGYLTKGTDIEEMVKAIHSVNSGKFYLAAEVAQQMAISQFKNNDDNPFAKLSEREMQVAMMVVNCISAQEIADKLFVSVKTVNTYRYRIFEKLGIDSDVKLTHLAIRYGLIKP